MPHFVEQSSTSDSLRGFKTLLLILPCVTCFAPEGALQMLWAQLTTQHAISDVVAWSSSVQLLICLTTKYAFHLPFACHSFAKVYSMYVFHVNYWTPCQVKSTSHRNKRHGMPYNRKFW